MLSLDSKWRLRLFRFSLLMITLLWVFAVAGSAGAGPVLQDAGILDPTDPTITETGPPTQDGQSDALSAAQAMSQAEYDALIQLEQAVMSEDWGNVEALLRQLPPNKYARLINGIADMMPRQRPLDTGGGAMTEAEEQRHLEADAVERARQAAREEANRSRTQNVQRDPNDTGAPLSGGGEQADAATQREPRLLRLPDGREVLTPADVLKVGTSPACYEYATLQAAVNAANDGDAIWVEGITFTGNDATVNLPDIAGDEKSLTIWGGLDSATCTGIVGRTTLDATGSFADSVVEIWSGSGETIDMYFFNITGGTPDGDYGGGIEISADHTVNLEGVSVYDNSSELGGGIYISAGTLNIKKLYSDTSVIYGNDATDDGGGIYCANATVTLSEDAFVGTFGDGNAADSDDNDNGNGGGAYLDSCTLNLDGTSSSAAVIYNSGYHGGGVYAINSSIINLDGVDSAIDHNTAEEDGGGVYLSDSADLWVDIGSVSDNNAGHSGGGVYAYGLGTIADMDTGGSTCSAAKCVEFSRNTANSLGGGAYVGRAKLDLESVYMEQNYAYYRGSAIYAARDGIVLLDSVMVTDGTGGGFNDYVIELFVGAKATINNSTIAGNTGNHGAILNVLAEARLDAFGLIIWGNDGDALVEGAGDVTIDCSVLQSAFPGSDNVVEDPIFVDAAGGNYHITRRSPAIDRCNGGYNRDVDYEWRPYDVGGIGSLAAPTHESLTRDQLNAQVAHVVRVYRDELGEVSLSETLDSVLRVVDFGSFLWLELSADQFNHLKASGTPFQEVSDYGVISFDRFHFDPVRDGEPPGIGGDLAGAAADENGYALHFVQLRNAPTNEDMDALNASGVELIQYYPHNTYLVWADERALGRLQADELTVHSPPPSVLPPTEGSGDGISSLKPPPDVGGRLEGGEWLSNERIRWIGDFHANYRLAGRLGRVLAQTTETALRLDVMALDVGSLPALATTIESLGGVIHVRSRQHVMGDRLQAVVWEVTLPVTEIGKLAYQPPVINVDIAMTPVAVDESSDQIIADNAPGGTPVTGYNDWLDDIGYDGDGVKVAIVDSGADWDHQDLNVVSGTEYGGYSEAGEPGSDGGGGSSGHGTHVAGIVSADGTSATTDGDGFIYGLGVAPGVTLHAQDFLDGVATLEQAYEDSANNADLSNNSWGVSGGGEGDGIGVGYTTWTRNNDVYMLDAIDNGVSPRTFFLAVFAAGNEGDGSGGICYGAAGGSRPCMQSIGSPTESKNIITVGATDSERTSGATGTDDISFFSSRGLAVDGRVKPDVAAPGDEIISTENSGPSIKCTSSPANSTIHSFCSGTSMASPHVAGVAALFTEFWRLRNDTSGEPLPSLVKAAIIATTDDLDGVDDGWDNTIGHRPDGHQGWGRVNADRLLSPTVPIQFYENPNLFTSSGQNWQIQVRPYDTAEPMRITLVWSDAPGAVNANPALVNNLDLRVTRGASTWRGNVFSNGWSTTGGVADTLNNVENVWIETPPSGTYDVRVDATSITGDAYYYNGDASDQHFSLVCYNCEAIVSGAYDAGADEAYAFVGLNGAACEYGSIVDAIAAASPGDTIYIPRGTYHERLGTIDKDLTLVQAVNDCTVEADFGQYEVTIDADDASATSGGVVYVTAGATVTMANLYLLDGSADYGGIAYVNTGATLLLDDTDIARGEATILGGGVRARGTVEVANGSWLFSNMATGSGHGGGVALGDSGALVLRDGSTVGVCWGGWENSSAGDGGGVYMDGGTLQMYDSSQVCDNVATANGGGVYGANGATIELYNSAAIGDTGVDDGNNAVDGGGVYLTGVGSTLTMNDSSTVRYNIASDDGGGIAVYDGATVVVDSAAILDNNSSAEGGGIYAEGGGVTTTTVTIANTASVNNNNAYRGGGIATDLDDVLVTVDNSQVNDNTANFVGGILLDSGDSTITIQNGSTVNGNDATMNIGGIAVEEGVNVVNILDSAVNENTAVGIIGGIYLGPGTNPRVNLTRSAIMNNTAGSAGGGVYLSSSGAILDMDGSAIEYNITGTYGGGIYHLAGTLDLDATSAASSISHNTAGGNGGGIYSSANNIDIWGIDGFPFVIDGNEAVDGGGIYVTHSSAFLDIYGEVAITNNTASGDGGGIYQDGGDGWVGDLSGGVRPLIAGNTASGDGGGAYLINVSDTAGPFFDGVDIVDNQAQGTGDGGGGVYADNSSFTMRNILVQNNRSSDDGGGLFLANGSTATVDTSLGAPTLAAPNKEEAHTPSAEPCNPNSLPADTYCSEFRDNEAHGTVGYGGAIYLTGGSNVTVADTAFINNTADYGGAIYSYSSGDQVSVSDSRFSDNVGDFVVRLRKAATLSLESSTIAGNPDTAVGVNDAGATITFNNNLIWGNAGGVDSAAAIGGSCNISQNGVGGLALDPAFITTARGDFHLGAGSAAVDACNTGPAHDLDNVTRPKDGDGSASAAEYDMGAFECRGGTAVAPVVSVTENGSDVFLAWTPNAANDTYFIYRSDAPYYTPDGATWIGASLTGAFTDAGYVGNPGTNYYYFVAGVTCAGIAEDSGVAEFDFAIVPGS